MAAAVLEQNMSAMSLQKKPEEPIHQPSSGSTEPAEKPEPPAEENKETGTKEDDKAEDKPSDDKKEDKEEEKSKEEKEEKGDDVAILTNFLPGDTFECCLGDDCVLGDKNATAGDGGN